MAAAVTKATPMNVELVYFANPMCSWCRGFAPVVRGLAQRHGRAVRLTVAVVRARRPELALPYFHAVQEAFYARNRAVTSWRSCSGSQPPSDWTRRASRRPSPTRMPGAVVARELAETAALGELAAAKLARHGLRSDPRCAGR